MRGLNVGTKRAQALKAAMRRKKNANILMEFAEHLADECTPSEAAFRAGASRADGAYLLDKLRRTIGLSQAK